MSEQNETPEWWEDDAKVDAFAERHRDRLIEKLGLGDLFAAPPDKPKAPKEGGGEKVRPQEMEGAMSSLVAALTKGVEMGATLAGAKSAATAPTAPTPKPKRKSWFFGEVEE